MSKERSKKKGGGAPQDFQAPSQFCPENCLSRTAKPKNRKCNDCDIPHTQLLEEPFWGTLVAGGKPMQNSKFIGKNSTEYLTTNGSFIAQELVFSLPTSNQPDLNYLQDISDQEFYDLVELIKLSSKS